uniref:Uncharacterized protein n=1 Tax=Spongospora subterranea TaxID=70186 RepID=A0A0H5RCL2_9EUKA|eukprot:CRZ11317.1 hypothetical protein [Spongospora subterranea]
MDDYIEEQFRSRLDAALVHIHTVLGNERRLVLAQDVPHKYDDKYGLAEVATRAAIMSQMTVFEHLGLNQTHADVVQQWTEQNRPIGVRFESSEKRTFVREDSRTVESPEIRTTTSSSLFGQSTTSHKIVKTVTDYVSNIEFSYKMTIFQRPDIDQGIILQQHVVSFEKKMTEKVVDSPVTRIITDTEVTNLMLHHAKRFVIDRSDKNCRTPRRNTQIKQFIRQLKELKVFFDEVIDRINQFFNKFVVSVPPYERDALVPDLGFIPVFPFFNHSGVVQLSSEDLAAFKTELQRTFAEHLSKVDRSIPVTSNIYRSSEVKLITLLDHGRKIISAYYDTIRYLEQMLYRQLGEAIGRIITPADLTNFMTVHYRKLFRDQYTPQPFCYSVRKPEHSSEGTITIESSSQNPIYSGVRFISPAMSYPIQMPISAAVKVDFGGERYIHTCLFTQFADDAGLHLNFISRSAQFSSFIVVIGNMVSARVFQPKAAIIVQNKDEVVIPLLSEQIPSAKEFRDAIESLSPEQQRFAKAMRSMQLENSLIGVAIIQIKPQLEKLLNIPVNSLTKEIQLTQDLTELLIKYQIPSDLLSFDGDGAAGASVKIDAVKGFVKNMQNMIQQCRDKQLTEAQEEAELRLASSLETVFPPSVPPPSFFPQVMSMSLPQTSGVPCSASVPNRSFAPMSGASRVQVQTAVVQEPQRIAAESASIQQAPVEESFGGQREAPSSSQQDSIPMQTGNVGEIQALSSNSITNDFTLIPSILDRQFNKLDVDGAVRPIIFTPGSKWTRNRQKTLLSKPVKETMDLDMQRTEKNMAFDLLDVISRSGTLPLEQASLHVLIAATHCFEKSLIKTITHSNINPIEKIEQSLLIMSSTVQDVGVIDLIKPEQSQRLQLNSPVLFPNAANQIMQ